MSSRGALLLTLSLCVGLGSGFSTAAPAAAAVSNPFEFDSAGRIIFGSGKAETLPSLCKSFGADNCLVVTGVSGVKRYEKYLSAIDAEGIKCHTYTIGREPEIDDIRDGVQVAKDNGCTLVVGIGGGSVVDAAKAIAALATNDGDIMDYVEVIGKGQPLVQSPLPFIAVPTTSGTGSEVTKNAVVKSVEHGRKVSIRSAEMLPDVALVDPELTVSAPPALTAHTGMDALTQCIEPYVSHMANPLTDGLCREGIARAAASLRTAFTEPKDIAARTDMAVASVFGGLALANAKLGAVHGFSGVLGGRFGNAPHGAVCAALLPHAFRVNARVLDAKRSESEAYALAYDRHIEVARMITGDENASAEDGAAWLEALARDLGIPKLPEVCDGFDINDAEQVKTICEESMGSSSMGGNPVKLTIEELSEILHLAS